MKRTEDQINLCRKATFAAKQVLKVGDKIRVSRCGGIRATYIFSHWDGKWIVSKSGIDDLSANSIDRLNGKPISFSAQGYAESINTMNAAPLTKPPKVRVADCPHCASVTPIQRKARGEGPHVSVCLECLNLFPVTDSRLIENENQN